MFGGEQEGLLRVLGVGGEEQATGDGGEEVEGATVGVLGAFLAEEAFEDGVYEQDGAVAAIGELG